MVTYRTSTTAAGSRRSFVASERNRSPRGGERAYVTCGQPVW
jgi:hypothetical protein